MYIYWYMRPCMETAKAYCLVSGLTKCTVTAPQLDTDERAFIYSLLIE